MTTLSEASRTTSPTPASPATAAEAKEPHRPTARPRLRPQADGMAVASFILGLLGTLVLNILLGPCALVLGGLSLARGTTRRGRALLGITLGAVDLLLLALLTSADGTLSWHIAG
ncbi:MULTISPECIES: DUF4190 domain-containing protein [unclassified Streptomyces]|uniref:DUF4190 domain-containing protein n=1 Tax=unclassified Streptomyces TaxID=2593676 RepID=UPI00088C4310|nr:MULTISPECIES: DUF4190 domain-containing protein [unclassified Streptomyces]PBC83008.1 hypothetical protein BX261_2930 [Streptomyces sp. 2321.6]SDR45684.1 hypothetical protein SAMN05216511_4272 [Streptomyces sp. KS_16]SEC80424.1 hypothetical protein SAMN05428940_2933 [Streptomyces sp. 2133.1]SEE88304.1 hypothetical protein SAMN05428954_4325 [Streptomyces sp. 2112.3]SNC69085.1 hypothetical protein SAMN06272741_2927 [Streptomyces sp. 2114.4]